MKMFIEVPRRVGLILICGLVATGCSNGTDNRKAGDAKLEIAEEINSLTRSYLDSRPEVAKQSLYGILDLLDLVEFHGVVTERILSYARLYSIESRHGDPDISRIYYEKARYWRLVAAEMAGLNPRRVLEELKAFSPEECDRQVIRWDTGVNRGMVARHMEPFFPGSAKFRMAREAMDAGEHGRALSFLEEAIESGHKEARFELALLLRSGKPGVAQDLKRVVALYRQLAMEGDDRIRVALAELYEEGRGVEKDDVVALKWYKLAEMSGDPRAPARIKRLETAMSVEERQTAELRAQQFLERLMDRGDE